jgi:hypothetical protein
MGRYLVLLMPILLSGCGLPLAVTIGSYAADGASYIATGKSVTDHGLTAVTGRDCALLRPILKSKPICEDQPMAREGPAPAPIQVGQNATMNPESAPALAVASARTGAQRYLVLGSFSEQANARQFAAGVGTKVAVVDASVKGKTVHRVVAGPLSDREVASLRSRLHDQTRPPAWEIGPVMVASAR